MTDQHTPDLSQGSYTLDDVWLASDWASHILKTPGSSIPMERSAARVLQALLPPPSRPTLADMTPEERRECQWMQADIIGGDEPLVITRIDRSDWSAVILDRNGRLDGVPAGSVTPRPDLPRLTWPGTEKPDTSATVPESTLAVGSVWSDINALTEACEESGRDQIVVSGQDGYAFIWDGMADWWEGSTPPRAAPFTILHTGHETDW